MTNCSCIDILKNTFWIFTLQMINSSDTRFEITEFGKDCSSISKHSLSDKSLCKEAAIGLGKVFAYEDCWRHLPKGCISDIMNKVYWNNFDCWGYAKDYTHFRAICSKKGIPTNIKVCMMKYPLS